VISVQSEANILQRAANEIKTLVELNSTIKANKEDSKADDVNSILKTKLQEQIRTGQITPFQAVKKESDTKNILG
jgi:hypothetical protein